MMKPRAIHFLRVLILFCGASVIAGRVDAAAPRVSVVAAPNGNRPVVARRDDSGTIHLVCDSSDGPKYFSTSDDGKTLSKPLPLVDASSRKPGLEFIVWDMTVTGNGTVHVALGNNAWKLKLPKDEWGYFYTRRTAADESFSPLKNINLVPSEGFSIAAHGEDKVTAVWMADKLFANVSTDGGLTFGPKTEIDPRLDPCNCCTTSCTYAPDGKLAILYREETNNERNMYVAIWNQSTNDVTSHRVGKTPWNIDQCPMTYYSITSTQNGFVTAWPTKGQIYCARLDRSGKPTGPEEIRTNGSNGMRTGIVALDAKGGAMVVIWKKDKRLSWKAFDRQGRPVGTADAIDSDGNGAAGTTTKSGDVVVFY